MANVVWPDELPSAPLFDGYQEALPNLVLRTQMDAGLAKVRRRYTAGPRLVRMLFMLTTEQKLLLDEFFLDSCEGGADRFEWVRPDTGDTVEFRFAQPVQYTIQGPDLWKAQVSLEWMPA